MDDDNAIKRFHSIRIIEHWLHALLFLILVVTGLSQKFYYLDISEYIILHLGGIDFVRFIHRYTGIFFAIYFMMHSFIALVGVLSGRWRPTMIITKKDFNDAVHNIKYYMGIERYPAPCDRYNYRQKFDYWSVLISSIIMITTGLMLWFPIFFTKFLPGEIIPAAHVMHTNQGMVVFIIIALWHIYNSVFSPDVFPIDTVIFTGYIPRDRMIREHPIELSIIEGRDIEDILHEQRELHQRTLEES